MTPVPSLMRVRRPIGTRRRPDTVRVVHLTSVHPADDIRILTKECSTLAAAGYDVTLVAPTLHSPRSGLVRVVAIRPPRNRIERVTRTTWAVYRQAVRRRARLYHFHDPELVPVGILLKVGGARVVYDVHEDLPRQIRTKSWIHPRVRQPIAAAASCAEGLAGRVLDGIIAVTPTIATRFPASKTWVVRNYPVLGETSPSPDGDAYAVRAPVIVYVGGISAIRGAREMVRAMECVRTPGATLILAGRSQPADYGSDLEREPGWSRVSMTGWLDRSEVASLLSRAKVGIVTLPPTANYVDSYPTKLFEYMAAGLPVVASDFPVWREIVETAGCGLLVDPTSPSAIAQAIDRLLADPATAHEMGQRGRAAVEAQFTWEVEGRRLVDLYERLGARR